MKFDIYRSDVTEENLTDALNKEDSNLKVNLTDLQVFDSNGKTMGYILVPNYLRKKFMDLWMKFNSLKIRVNEKNASEILDTLT